MTKSTATLIPVPTILTGVTIKIVIAHRLPAVLIIAIAVIVAGRKHRNVPAPALRATVMASVFAARAVPAIVLVVRYGNNPVRAVKRIVRVMSVADACRRFVAPAFVSAAQRGRKFATAPTPIAIAMKPVLAGRVASANVFAAIGRENHVTAQPRRRGVVRVMPVPAARNVTTVVPAVIFPTSLATVKRMIAVVIVIATAARAVNAGASAVTGQDQIATAHQRIATAITALAGHVVPVVVPAASGRAGSHATAHLQIARAMMHANAERVASAVVSAASGRASRVPARRQVVPVTRACAVRVAHAAVPAANGHGKSATANPAPVSAIPNNAIAVRVAGAVAFAASGRGRFAKAFPLTVPLTVARVMFLKIVPARRVAGARVFVVNGRGRFARAFLSTARPTVVTVTIRSPATTGFRWMS